MVVHTGRREDVPAGQSTGRGAAAHECTGAPLREAAAEGSALMGELDTQELQAGGGGRAVGTHSGTWSSPV